MEEKEYEKFIKSVRDGCMDGFSLANWEADKMEALVRMKVEEEKQEEEKRRKEEEKKRKEEEQKRKQEEQKRKQEVKQREREQRLQEARLKINQRYGKNAILKGLNFDDGATGIERNLQIGGHKA